MIGRRSQRKSEDVDIEQPKGFDAFEVRLGDTMRGERATMGKSLLDVQRELRIKANYIAAIENSDPTAFDTPGFIAGYVRSYARYLGMNPDDAFARFCEESGFEVAHGMSAEASVVKKSSGGIASKGPMGHDPFMAPNTPFVPGGETLFSHIEPRAIGSVLVLIALIGGIGYGGWSVLKEVQQVQVAPVEQTPVVLSDLDPLEEAARAAQPNRTASLEAPNADALDRLYRPQALDVPVLVSRDAPISTLDPRTVGNFRAPALPEVDVAVAEALDFDDTTALPQVVEDAKPSLRLVAVNPAWMRVTAADGSIIYEGTLGTVNGGNFFDLPLTEEAPQLRVGASGSAYIEVNGTHYGPLGPRGTVTSGVVLSTEAVVERFQVADLEDGNNSALKEIILQAQATVTEEPSE